jgi:hypothetical protein
VVHFVFIAPVLQPSLPLKGMGVQNDASAKPGHPKS